MKTIDAYEVNNGSKTLLNANECYKNLPENIINEIKDNLEEVLFNRYPDNSANLLTKTYSNAFNINEGNFIFGNGSDEMLGLVIGLNINEGKKLYTLTPDFSMYDYYTSFHGGDMVKYPIDLDKGFNVDDFIKKGKEDNVSIIIFSNPNNPTGTLVSKDDIKKILNSFNIPVIIDEAYGEFCDCSMVDEIDNYKNLYVTKTLSKAYGVAGIRLGMIISNKGNIDTLRDMKVPYNVNSVTQYIGSIILNHKEELDVYSKEIIKRRDNFYNEIINRKYKDLVVYPSHANFIYGKSSMKDELVTNMLSNGISIRNYKDDSFRITIGSDLEMEDVLSVIDYTYGGSL